MMASTNTATGAREDWHSITHQPNSYRPTSRGGPQGLVRLRLGPDAPASPEGRQPDRGRR